MPISQEITNGVWSDSITMVAEWNHFIFMQIDNPIWLPGTGNNNSTNTKMTVSQEPLDEIDPSLCQNVSCIGRFVLFKWNYFKFMQIDYNKMAVRGRYLKSINIKMTISQEKLLKLIQLYARMFLV